MRKLFITLLSLLLVACAVLPVTVFAATNETDYKTWTDQQFADYLTQKAIPLQVTSVYTGSPYQINFDILRDRGLLVYGKPEDIAPATNNQYQNELRDDRWRYLGLTISGTVYNNIYFPPDGLTSTNVGTRNWIKYPWDAAEAGNLVSPYMPEKNEIMTLTPIATKIEWLDKLTDKYIGNGLTRGNWEAYGWTGSKLVDFAVIEQPPTDYGPGQATMWHKWKGSVWYDSFFIPPMKQLLLSNNQQPDPQSKINLSIRFDPFTMPIPVGTATIPFTVSNDSDNDITSEVTLVRNGITPKAVYESICDSSGKDCKLVIDHYDNQHDKQTLKQTVFIPANGVKKVTFSPSTGGRLLGSYPGLFKYDTSYKFQIEATVNPAKSPTESTYTDNTVSMWVTTTGPKQGTPGVRLEE